MYRSIRRVGFVIIVILFASFANVFSHYLDVADTPGDCLVVFGAAVWPGEFGPVASHALRDRTHAAAELYQSGLSECIVLSGADSVYGAHEVDLMTDLLVQAGVPLEVLEFDREGIDTGTTVANLDTGRSYVLISNDFHLARIALFAWDADIEYQLHAAEYVTGGRYTREPYFVMREVVAWWYYLWDMLLV